MNFIKNWDGKVLAHAANGRGLVGGAFHLDFPSVGATETLMMAASMADGVTVLSNVAKEPEVVDLARFLNDSGACVRGAGSDKILIQGKYKLHGSEFSASPDRIEAGTFMLAAAITRSRISLSPVIPSHLSCLIDKLTTAGCKIMQCNPDTLEVSAIPENVHENLRGFDVKTSPFPGFPTDFQPQTMALLTTCSGSSILEESVFEKRMGHARELQKLGAKIRVCGSTALVFGRENGSALHGSQVSAADLRGGVSLVLAGLAADGTTEISGIAHIDRGYENIEAKLQLLGADIKRSIAMAYLL
ncbi:UDP-N-acetylglucosamine 1-carboxyvinyltransferase [Melia azedarach]|uniref:UDP-N-acetylglucosamine 1-carboxyvinyltransferase n=1 Tax=Melia azedarach TaxID=155640 RepID=A0ACC1YSL0_MELAZ|nr:UDP-N-acetylglucosamine 1-carboxyvinyltransferase [Melia azedarach]